MRSMREDGYRKVMAGVTTLDEVLMVTTEDNKNRVFVDYNSTIRDLSGKLREFLSMD